MTKFGVLILTHGRPDRVKTYRALKRGGYTGPVVLVVDDEDKTLPEYRSRYGAEVFVFSKEEAARGTDAGDNLQRRDTVLYARNASFGIAEQLGWDYFVQLDDDYSYFEHVLFEGEGWFRPLVKNLDGVFAAYVEFLERTQARTVAFAQGGDFMGGAGTSFRGMKRKAMNAFFCATKRPFTFYGRLNDDVNTYVVRGGRGELFFTPHDVALHQEPTQKAKGGLTEMYLEMGTYAKSFYTVMYAPSCTKITLMGQKDFRLHHRVKWRYAVPVLLDEKYKK